MTFLEQLQSHKGGLIRMKTELYWYDGRGYDNTPGRICLLLDAEAAAAARRTAAKTAAARATAAAPADRAAALLLIEGQPQWIWVTEQDIELLVNDQPIS
jgi:hypothetical protein